MTEKTHDAELFLRFHRRSMITILVLVVAAGAFMVASALWPDAAPLRWVERAPWFFPLFIITGVAVQQTSMRRYGIALDSPEYKALMSDEWRRQAMARATKGALIVVLVAQLVLPLLFVSLPTLRAVWGMAAATITLGLATQVALFLFFDRE